MEPIPEHAPLAVCHIITRLIVGGAQENTLATVAGLAATGRYRVCLVAGPTTGPEGSLLPVVRSAGIWYHESPSLIREVRPAADARALADLVRFLRRHRFAIVHTHSAKGGILGRWAARLAGVPIVVHTVHGWSFGPYQSWPVNAMYEWLEYLTAHCTDRLVGVADAMRDEGVRRRIAPPARFTTIHSGIDLARFRNARRDDALAARLGIAPEDKVVVTLARLFPLKGHDALLDAMPEILAREPRARFLWIGDGTLRDGLLARARRLGVADRLVLAGLIQPDEVPRYLALGRLLVHLSRREGLPRAVPQAFACGLPAIGYPLDGTPEVIRPGETGRLVPVGDRVALVDAVAGLLADEEGCRRMGAAGRALAAELFAADRMVARIDRLYQELEAARRRRGAPPDPGVS